jgi:heme/copper-type cytochrome/quinol oxidase subunit 4
VAGYLNIKFHGASEKIEIQGLSTGFFTAVVYTVVTVFLTLASAIANTANAGNAFIAWIISVIFAFAFFMLGGYLSGYLERRPFAMPTIFNLGRISQAPPPPPGTSARMCPTCGQPMTFIQQYNKWYCNNCKKYA